MWTDFQLLVCFLKYLPNKTPIFREKIVLKNAIFGPNSPPPARLWCPVQVFVSSQTNVTVSSFIRSHGELHTKHEGRFCLTISNFARSLAAFEFVLKVLSGYFCFCKFDRHFVISFFGWISWHSSFKLLKQLDSWTSRSCAWDFAQL